MKMSLPDTNLKGTLPETVTTVIQPSKDEKSGSRLNKKWVCGVVGILVGLVIVATTVLLAVHFGSKIATDAVKHYQVQFQNDNGMYVKETITTRDDERKYHLDGHDLEVIYDTKNGFVVYKAGSVCYIRNFNTTELAGTFIQNGTISLQGKTLMKTNEKHYVSTGIKLPNMEILSTLSRTMCEEKPVFWMTEDTSYENKGFREKRRIVSTIETSMYLQNTLWDTTCSSVSVQSERLIDTTNVWVAK